jgi:hypothetical protein
MVAGALLAAVAAGPAQATGFSYTDFSSITGLTLNGDAAQSGSVLRLVPSVDTQGGTAFYATPLALGAGFSTAFSFNVTTDPSGGGAPDGFSFILQNSGATALGAGGQGLGYAGLAPSVAVAFRGRGPSFVGVITGGVDPADLTPPFDPPGSASGLTEGMFYGQTEFAWIDYAGGTLDVYLSDTNVKPGTPIATGTVDLSGMLGSSIYAGFGAGNGAGFGNQDLLSWTLDTTEVPEPPAALILAAAMLGLIALRRRCRTEE